MKPLVIFDFDGVLVDSFDVAFGLMKELMPGQDFTEADYRECFEGNVYDSEIEAKYCFVVPGFFEAYLPRLIQLSPIDGIADMIQKLSVSHALAIVSSTTSQVIKGWLERYQLASYFSDILGEDISRSKVEKMKMLLERYQIESNQCLFVTDTLGDLKEAKAVGIPSVAVTYGWNDESVLRKGEFVGLAHEPGELLGAIESALK